MRRDFTPEDFHDELFIRVVGNGPRQIPRAIVELEDTGIYKREKIVDVKSEEVPFDEFQKRLCDLVDFDTKVRTELDSCESLAAKTLRPYAVEVEPGSPAAPRRWISDKAVTICNLASQRRISPPQRQNFGDILAALSTRFHLNDEVFHFDLGHGKKPYAFPEDLPDDAQDALIVLLLARIVRERLKEELVPGELKRLRGAAQPGDMYAAFQLGQMMERLKVRSHEPDALLGRKKRASAPAASSERSAQTEARKEWARQAFDEELKKDPKNRKKALGAVLKAFRNKFRNVSITPSTIKRYVSTPRNDGRK